VLLVAPCMLASVLVSGTLAYFDQRSNVIEDEWLLKVDGREDDRLVVRTYGARTGGGGLLLKYEAWFTRDPQNVIQHKPSPLLSHFISRNPQYPDFVDRDSDPPFRTIHFGGVRFMGERGGPAGDGEGRITHLFLVVPLRLLG
jgi:hypothetical protein